MRRRQTPALIRRHLNLGADYVLRCVGLLSDVFGGDIISGLVFLAAVQASTQHLRNPSAQDDCEEEFFPDEVRRPASLSAIARSLGIPVETTRRHVIKLERAGFAHRSKGGGVLVTADILAREDIRAAMLANSGYVLRLNDGVTRSEMIRDAGAGRECPSYERADD
ncbi:hypothetical protein [Caulobacter sp.]|uniref:hypothetical protein n=1 Tax=Caulobacter sp. TaxID=78 RepID=UPI003BAA538D